VRIQVLTVASVKMTALWDIASCSLVEVYRRFRGAYCLHYHGDESSVYLDETTRCYITESYLLQCEFESGLSRQEVDAVGELVT
jgi:hypothetical protein